MAVENIIDAFYNACGRGDLATVQRYFAVESRELNTLGLHSAIDKQHLEIVGFLLPHMKTPLTIFNKKVVATDNVKLFNIFYNCEDDAHKERWLEMGMVNAIHANRRLIIEHCFEHVYSPQWWERIRHTWRGGKGAPIQLGFEHLEEQVKMIQQREMLEGIVSGHGTIHARKL